MSDEFARMVVCTWKADGKTEIAIPVQRLTETFRNRLAPKQRPYKAGAKIDNTGPDHLVWIVESIFHNGSAEQGIKATLYPDELNKLCESFTVQETGTLTLSTRGPKRCKLQTYERVEDNGAQDCATLRTTFFEDSEDDVNASSFTAPSASSVAVTLAGEVTEACEESSIWDGDVSSFNELGAQLEGLANAPGEFVDSIEAQANSVVKAIDRVEKAFTKAASEGATEVSTLMTDPATSRAGRLMRKLSDTARTTLLRTTGLGRIVIKRFPREVSIFDVATLFATDPTRLLALNSGLANPLRIPPKTPVRVPEAP